MSFVDKIENHLAKNQITYVIDAFSELKRSCPLSETNAMSDIRQLNSQVIVLSSKFNNLNERVNMGTTDSRTENMEKSSIIRAFTDILNQLPNTYPDLYKYIQARDEEYEWKDTQAANTVTAYEQYFNKYSPNGKYIESTKKLISELREIERKREDEKKNLAQEARSRREQDTRRHDESKPPETFKEKIQVPESVKPVNKGSNKTLIYMGAGAVLLILLIFILKPKNNSRNDLATSPVVTETQQEMQQEARVFCRDCRVWKFLWIGIDGIQYDALLVFNPSKGYGKMRVKYFDGNANRIIQEEMNQVSTDQGQYLEGRNPFDTETFQPLVSYMPDNVAMNGENIVVFDINGDYDTRMLPITDVVAECSVFGFSNSDLDF